MTKHFCSSIAALVVFILSIMPWFHLGKWFIYESNVFPENYGLQALISK